MESWKSTTLEELKSKQRHFALERNWEQYHQPRNLLLALTAEVGELCEIFQWRGEVKPSLEGFTDKEKHHVGEELADVLLYIIRMSDICDIDLAKAAEEKILKNGEKYPVEKCQGRSDKYTAYHDT